MYRFQLFFVPLRLKWYYMKKTVWPLMAVLLVFVAAPSRWSDPVCVNFAT